MRQTTTSPHLSNSVNVKQTLCAIFALSHSLKHDGALLNPTTIGISIASSLANTGLPATLSHLCAFAFLLIIEVALLAVLFKLIQSTADAALKAAFRKRYHIELSNAVTIRPLLSASEQGTVALHIPFWRYGNKDGSRDKRRQDNRLIYKKSFLTISHFSIASYEPYIIYWLYKELILRGVSFTRPEIFHDPGRSQTCVSKPHYISRPPSQAASVVYEHYSSHPTVFEEYCADIFRQQGYKAETTPKTNDGGFDIKMVDPQGRQCIVECKCYNPANESVGRDTVQKLVGANAIAQAQRMIFITTARFTDSAIQYAKSTPNPVELIDGNKLEQIIRGVPWNQPANSNRQECAGDRLCTDLSWAAIVQYYPPDVSPHKDTR